MRSWGLGETALLVHILCCQSGVMRDAYPTRAARKILRLAISIAPDDTREWGQGMLSEPNQVQGNWAALLWAIGGASVLAEQAALPAIFRDGPQKCLTPGARSVSVVSEWQTTHSGWVSNQASMDLLPGRQ